MSETAKQLGPLPWRLMMANGVTLLIEDADDVARLGKTISRAPPKDASTQPVGEAIDKLMHAWVMGERWVRLDDVKAALATPATATQETRTSYYDSDHGEDPEQ